MSNPGIYIHIPFCIRKCLYCDFYSVTDTNLYGPFVEALIKEIEGAKPLSENPDTLYIGGGTPSVLDPMAISSILDAVRRRFSLQADAEITLEVNPGTVTLEKLRAYKSTGVNRLNIGVQSFDDQVLSFLGRCHLGIESHQAVLWAREAGFGNIGLDLIYGLPDQSSDGWRKTLKEGFLFQPEHFSCYTLTYEPGTPMDHMRKAGDVCPMREDDVAEFIEKTVDVLTDAGYEHYEISNFARLPEYRSRHNQKYWDHTPYLGFGPAAHSFSGHERRWNISDAAAYIRRMESGRSPVGATEVLIQKQLMVETIYLGLRTKDGIDVRKFKERFDVSFSEWFSSLLKMLQEEKLLTLAKGRCALTERGMRFHDFITQSFVDRMV